ncbi:hypothetical protein SKAU_G00367930 [Synaphobranchus kaupii]|uniref:Uncharacterized protein n=1 Tax=Synaphobranchus kaupii TaxID=118154 RepID=A0A9Q1EFH8_SYNKA|nr:hypothetical protein SKAU_G00367930 [Synaphobranchus kaupii]
MRRHETQHGSNLHGLSYRITRHLNLHRYRRVIPDFLNVSSPSNDLMDPSEVTPSDGMAVMMGVLVTSLAIAAASLWVFYRRRAGNGRATGTQEGKGQKDSKFCPMPSPKQSQSTPLKVADTKQEVAEEEEDVEEQSFS